jgi:hypothetical protein
MIYVFKDLRHYAITALCIYNNLELQKWERSSQLPTKKVASEKAHWL